MRLVETPARHTSITASPAEASRRRQRSMIAVVNRIPLSLGMRIVTSPDDVVGLLS